jgi:hypothetical protein
MDVVGYLNLLINDQSEILALLNRVVRETRHFQEAEAADGIIRLATGDGLRGLLYQSRCTGTLRTGDEPD